MAEFIGGPIDEGVVNQLKVRSDVLSRTAGNEKFLKSGLFNNAWINVVSSANLIEGVDSEKGAELAKRYVLSGGSLTWNGSGFNMGGGIDFTGTSPNKVYNYSEAKGVRPRPGITGFSIVSKNRFGAIREATINFNVWSQEDLVNIERLYFRPGFHAVVEWGHSEFVNNDSGLETGATGVTPEFFNDLDTPSKIAGILKEVTDNRSYNYDSFVGVIKNFSYSFRQDGGYDCVISIISKGEILDSIRLGSGFPSYVDSSDEKGFANINVLTFLTKVLVYDYSYWNNGEEDILVKSKDNGDKGLVDYIDDAIERVKREEGRKRAKYARGKSQYDTEITQFDIQASARRIEQITKTALLAKQFLDTIEGNFIGITKEIDTPGFTNYVQTYLPLPFVLDLINFQIELSLTDEEKRKIDVPKFSNKDVEAPMAMLEKSIILDPEVCLIYNRPDPDLYPLQNEKIYQTLTNNLPKKPLKKDVSNIFIGSKLLMTLCKRYLGTDIGPDGSLAKDFIEDMMDQVSLALGGINEFVITYDETTNTAYIEDKKTTPVQGEGALQGKEITSYTLPLTGLKSFISNVTVQTKISNQLGSQIAIAAQGSSTDRDYNAYVANYKEWNRNLYDRYTVTSPAIEVVSAKEKMKNQYKNTVKAMVEENKQKLTLEEKRVNFESNLQELYEDFRKEGNYDPEDWKSIKTHGQTLYVQEEEYEDKAAGRPPKGLIPTELSFTMDGIGGLKIGQSFKVQEGILPFTYNRYGYIITGLEHSIQAGKWMTTVRAQTFILQFE